VVAGADPPGAGVLVGRTTSWLLPPPHAARRLAPAAALAAIRNSRRYRRRVVMVSILPGTHGTHNPYTSCAARESRATVPDGIGHGDLILPLAEDLRQMFRRDRAAIAEIAEEGDGGVRAHLPVAGEDLVHPPI